MTVPAAALGPAPRDTVREVVRAPEPAPLPAPERRAPAAPPTPTPAPTLAVRDTSKPRTDSLREHRLAADSIADQAALEQLANARPAHSEGEDLETPTSGPKALASAATWDIDVASFSDHDRVHYYLDFFEGKGRERMGVWLNRMPRYETMIRERLQKEGLPADLAYLALIESGFSNAATSRARAVGMWQFMKGTARLYGLRVDSWVDERRDPYRSTDAAARHLRDLTHRFGSVYLAAAAYNAGAGRVSRGLGRLPDGEDDDSLTSDAAFFRLYDTKSLRRETKDYVPKLIAAALIAKEPARYGFTIAPEAPAAYDSIIVPDMTGLDVIARLADTTVTAIRELNPQYLRLATPPGTSSIVRLPPGRGPATELAYAELPVRERVTVIEHVVRRGETLSGIARRYGVRQSALAGANPKLVGRRVRVGQTLVVPTGIGRPIDMAWDTPRSKRASRASRAAGTTQVSARGNRSAWHRVRRGETLTGIAATYGVTVRELRTWNALSTKTHLRAGQRLRIAATPSRASR